MREIARIYLRQEVTFQRRYCHCKSIFILLSLLMVTFQRRLQMSLLICGQNNNNIYYLILATTIVVADSNLTATTLIRDELWCTAIHVLPPSGDHGKSSLHSFLSVKIMGFLLQFELKMQTSQPGPLTMQSQIQQEF